ncbi:hypothetical protein M5362_25575 [Streptomyces sp. Je 1-79]|uniref:hypothetical protein n=1 Tax=Streptomyces sp. Je 1-79 TaxID=2943847 RepID=UPI0021A3D584|nr:hypothetical protein [Streptomyces sp. Je 1-79]MCT4356504.1 hypothetical protein [Streptomyces sp. Je 1-79]
MLFAMLPLFSIGFLTWGTMIRLAVVTRRTRDWILCGVSAAVMITGMILLPEDIETTQADIAMGLILLNATAFTVYFLVVDIRHDKVRLGLAPSAPAPYSPYGTTVPRPQTGYGYPSAAVPPQPVAPPQQQQQQPHQPQPHQPPRPQSTPTPTPPVQNPQPGPRIDQVRAELDELSNLLRKDEGK